MGMTSFFKKRWNFFHWNINDVLSGIVFLHYFRRRLHKTNGATEFKVALQSCRFNSQSQQLFVLNLLAVNRHPTLLETLHLLLCCQNYTESEIIWRKPVNLFRFRPCQVTGIFWLEEAPVVNTFNSCKQSVWSSNNSALLSVSLRFIKWV
jgi:hypothetical protein